jgi:hypothetical protein
MGSERVNGKGKKAEIRKKRSRKGRSKRRRNRTL